MKGAFKILTIIGLGAGTSWAGMAFMSRTDVILGISSPVSALNSYLSHLFPEKAIPPIHIGESRQAVRQKLGEPTGESKSGEIVTLFYEGGGIDFKDGRVIRVEPDFAETTRDRRVEHRFEAKQLKKGLVKYNGAWIPEEEARGMRAYAGAVKASRRRSYAAQHRPRTRAMAVMAHPSTSTGSSKPQPKKLSTVNHGLDGNQDYTVKGKPKTSCSRR